MSEKNADTSGTDIETTESAKTPDTFDHKTFLQNLTAQPGVYQMFDAGAHILYVGKASNLKKRVASYFRANGLSVKNQSLMQQVADIQIVVTHSETEALILENNPHQKTPPAL